MTGSNQQGGVGPERDALAKAALQADPHPPPSPTFWPGVEATLQVNADAAPGAGFDWWRLLPALSVAAGVAIALLVITNFIGDGDPTITTSEPSEQGLPPVVVEVAATPTATAVPTATALPTVTPTPAPTATPVPALAPVGRFATVKPEVTSLRVYDEPDGEPRTLVYTYLDGTTLEFGLTNPTYLGTNIVLKVLAGGEGDAWLQVQVPVRPSDASVWIRAEDVELAASSHEIRADRATGTFEVWEGSTLMLSTQAAIGALNRPTPLGATWVDDIVPGPNAAYGSFIISVADFSDSLNTFSAGLPKMAIHGTNEPEKVAPPPTGAVSAGALRLRNDDIEAVVEMIEPGTPIVVFDSSDPATDYDSIVAVPLGPAPTRNFNEKASHPRSNFI